MSDFFKVINFDNVKGAVKPQKYRNCHKDLIQHPASVLIGIVFLDNVEYLNLNSSNALLKGLEEPSQNTFFFIIHDNSSFILDTIKSRCVQFKFNFTNIIQLIKPWGS